MTTPGYTCTIVTYLDSDYYSDLVTMFSVTPVPENKERKVSFSPDIDQSYRHHVVDKIRNLMDEVQVCFFISNLQSFDMSPSLSYVFLSPLYLCLSY